MVARRKVYKDFSFCARRPPAPTDPFPNLFPKFATRDFQKRKAKLQYAGNAPSWRRTETDQHVEAPSLAPRRDGRIFLVHRLCGRLNTIGNLPR